MNEGVRSVNGPLLRPAGGPSHKLRSGVGVIRSRALSGHKRTSAGEADDQGWAQGEERGARSLGARLKGAPKAQQS